MSDNEFLTSNRQELRRGTVVLACLLALRERGYGYGLLDALAAAGVPVEANTLYPLLRRLESQGLLVSEWDTSEARPRKFYRTSRQGLEMARELQTEWEALSAALRRLDSTEGEIR
jgi:PadR family transcriptional regulator, regulatory protein PadR